MEEGVIEFLRQTNPILLFGPLTIVQNFIKWNKNCGRSNAHRYRQTQVILGL